MKRRVWLAAALAAALPLLAAPARTGTVAGRVALGLGDVEIAAVGPIVVYLDGVEGRLDFPVPRRPATIVQRDAKFLPGFLVVTAGQTVSMPNQDLIFHSVFSYSRPNVFDLSLYGAGESRDVVLHHPGLVRLYCSIHESMNGAVYVAPSPWFALARDDGSFEIRGAPPGRYRLRTWSERLQPTETTLTIAAGERVERTLDLGANSP